MRRSSPRPGTSADDVLRGLRPDPDPDHAWRHANVGRLMLTAFHRFELRVLAHLEMAGYRDIRLTHFNVLRHVDFEGTRINDLATRVGITKGAMGQLVRVCAELGMVRVRADSTDGRAKVVTFTARGQRFMEAARQAITRAEGEFEALLGKEDLEALRRILQKIYSMPAPPAR